MALLWLMVLCVTSPPAVLGADPSDLFDPRKVIETLPRDLVKAMDVKSTKRDSAVEEGSKKLGESFNNKPATASFRISLIVANENGYVVGTDKEHVRVAGAEFTMLYEIYLSKDEGAKLRVGDKVTVAGTSRVHITGGQALRLWLTMMDGSLK